MYPPGTSPASTHPGVQTGHVVSDCVSSRFPYSLDEPRTCNSLPCAVCFRVTKARNAMTAWAGRMRKLSLPIGLPQAREEKWSGARLIKDPCPPCPWRASLSASTHPSSPSNFLLSRPLITALHSHICSHFAGIASLSHRRPSNLLSLPPCPSSTPPVSHCRTAHRRQHGDHG